nr:helix-turn-helix domain-containing protein [uncultured Ruminococcus sp.]
MTEKFSIISNRISDYRLKPKDYAVYCCLVKHSDKNGVCFPSRRLIAEKCCIDKKTMDAAIRSLEKAGLVKKKKRRRQDGSNTSNTYEYSAKVEHPDRFELNSATAKIEQSNRRN